MKFSTLWQANGAVLCLKFAKINKVTSLMSYQDTVGMLQFSHLWGS